MFRRPTLLCATVRDRADYAVTLARLSILDRFAGPPPETPPDRAIREQGERLREAFPRVDFDDPGRHVRRGCSATAAGNPTTRPMLYKQLLK
jgi:hypothetical protein